jgi:flagellar protein FliL
MKFATLLLGIALVLPTVCASSGRYQGHTQEGGVGLWVLDTRDGLVTFCNVQGSKLVCIEEEAPVGEQVLTPLEQIEQVIARKLKESGQLPEDAGEEPKVDEIPTLNTSMSYFEFDLNFTSALRDSRKFLQLAVAVSTQYGEAVVTNLKLHQLALRSEVLGIISDFTEDDIGGKIGRDRLAAKIVEAINAKLEVLEGFGGISHVHFTSFNLL